MIKIYTKHDLSSKTASPNPNNIVPSPPAMINAPADRREKIWWTQAEALIGALHLYRLTWEEVYFSCFTRTLDWILKYQADWKNGDWHACVKKNGRSSGDKAGAWKSPYHNGRAMIRCLELLQLLPQYQSVEYARETRRGVVHEQSKR